MVSFVFCEGFVCSFNCSMQKSMKSQPHYGFCPTIAEVSRIVRLGDQIFDMGRFHSEIAFYSTVAYSDLKVPVRYVDGEVVFAEHKLEDAHLQMELPGQILVCQRHWQNEALIPARIL